MAEAISTAAGSMELALKETNVGGLIVDMTPSTAAALLHHNAMALRSLKEAAVSAATAASAAAAAVATASASESEQPESRSRSRSRSLATTPTPTLTPTATATPTPTALAMSSSLGPHSPPDLMTFRCERCENFETSSRASLLLHVVQCLAGQVGQAVRLKSEEMDEPENMSVSHMDKSASDAHMAGSNGSSSSASSSPAGNGGGGGSGAGGGGGGGVGANASRKVFECDVCNMKFSNGANMRRHKMRHTGVKPYECRVCQKRFFRKDHLAEHFTTHTKTLPYHCPICNRGFQRQIAMRAHFQNEHVGQHDLVKTCPLCSYRAGSMKSLRIHFFNRHGIDLDNPGPGGTSSLLLALESQASAAAAAAAASYGQQTAATIATAAAATAATAATVAAVPATTIAAAQPAGHHSDSGESMRSLENATPPMHFLTPHVEISTLNENGNTELFNGNNSNNNNNSSSNSNNSQHNNNNTSHINNNHNSCQDLEPAQLKEHAALLLTAPQDLPMDCNTKATPITSSTGLKSHQQQQQQQQQHLHHQQQQQQQQQHNHHHPHHHHHHHENHITPSISLIPIKQEPLQEDVDKKELLLNGSAQCEANSDADLAGNQNNNNNNNSSSNNNNNNNRITSLIKVSPLKSLLREDLKRRICAKANNRITRNATTLEHELQSMPQQHMMNGGAGSGSVMGSGVAGSVGSASSTPNGNHSGTAQCATPICNGTITSSGQESDSLVLSRKQILTCHFCGIEFPDETLYFLHKGCHCESNPWKCNICGEQLNNVYEFNSHLLSKSHQ